MQTINLKQRASVTHGTVSQKNINEAVDQRTKQLSVYKKVKDIFLKIMLN